MLDENCFRSLLEVDKPVFYKLPEIKTVAEKASWELANRGQKLGTGMVWKIERKSAKLLMTTYGL
jgi:hypothetical protein